MGPNIGVFDTDRITAWNDLCGRMGIDTISTGATLAWVRQEYGMNPKTGNLPLDKSGQAG